MAKSNAVWGIDIGQCALKALRCRAGDEPGEVQADAFDYIEYPKILSQPDADPAELVREALELFLSRNSLRGDGVAISVSGQSGLARFIKLPPVESKKIPDIVKYEAKQQIPFALEDVVWDYQQMAGGSEEDGFALETEVGLFAMKRDQVFRALRPFEEAGIEVDVIQLTPLTIYNYTVFDQMQDLPPAEQYDPDDPPESVVVLSLGTDTTDLVITNGYRVWQRSIPLGGSHFTKALTKELRLTFAKAEHLKKNASQAEDPKAVFQAMRPVFNDLVTEIQRSIGYFTSIDRGAKIGRVITLGNAMKLPGLQKYLSQNLGHPVSEVQKYRGITGEAVVGEPAFKDNLLSFAVCYGLVLQGLGLSTLSTNLLPREIVTDRLIRDKKPWAVAMVATLLLGCTISFFGHWRAWNSVAEGRFKEAESAASSIESQASGEKAGYDTSVTSFKDTNKMGEDLIGNVDGRLLWLELYDALNQCLPADPADKRPPDLADRNELHIESINCERFTDLGTWYQQGISDLISKQQMGGAGAAPAAGAEGAPPAAPVDPSADPAAAAAAAAGGDAAAADAAPSGAGWVIQLVGYHYHNKDLQMSGSTFVRDTLIKQLRDGKVKLPGKDGQPTEVSTKDLGISHPVIVSEIVAPRLVELPGVAPAPDDANGVPRPAQVKRFDFILQFAWQPTPLGKRIEKAEERAKQQQEQQQQQQQQEALAADGAAAAEAN
ncbi:MAG: type IV pilus assembly protein PilM [Pirellulales bacterium]